MAQDNSKRRLFTPTNRLKAITRQEAKALLELFEPREKKYAVGWYAGHVSGKAKYSREKDARYAGASSEEGIRINPAVKPSIRKRDYFRSVVAHEITHDAGLTSNDLVASHAVDWYFFGKLTRNTITNGKEHISGQYAENAFLRIQKAFQPKAYEAAIVKSRTLEDAEYRRFLGGQSFARIGEDLGAIALHVEAWLEKPGIGLVLIREVAKGGPVTDAIAKVRSGTFDAELERWRKKNPGLERFLTRKMAAFESLSDRRKKMGAMAGGLRLRNLHGRESRKNHR